MVQFRKEHKFHAKLIFSPSNTVADHSWHKKEQLPLETSNIKETLPVRSGTIMTRRPQVDAFRGRSAQLPSAFTPDTSYLYLRKIYTCTGVYIKRCNLGILINNWVALKMGRRIILFLYWGKNSVLKLHLYCWATIIIPTWRMMRSETEGSTSGAHSQGLLCRPGRLRLWGREARGYAFCTDDWLFLKLLIDTSSPIWLFAEFL